MVLSNNAGLLMTAQYQLWTALVYQFRES